MRHTNMMHLIDEARHCQDYTKDQLILLAGELGEALEGSALMATEDVAKALGVSDRTVIRYMQQEGLPSVKLGMSRRFIREEVEAWVRDRKDNVS